ncbi:dTDP-4-dehydrorhamnose reductase [Flavobacteriaceae bacterium 14752]|uniref:dTDP-4-dehydrorhamnose reductase n=1 Tax=Mesohalobacter salilacus TaxID=2491711 RepID=UPI000F63315F|nr:dTDP-4-dehydrorhamnose reductase [Flavobacteriaceae bacterium 14752]
MNILVTGANGQLGQTFKDLQSQYKNHKFTFAGRKALDITKAQDVMAYFEQNQFDCVLNCAAYTAVDQAEDEPDQAYLINKTGVEHLVKACESFNVRLIHFSTDYVFNGQKNQPYSETDAVNPQCLYGASKLAGETLILNSKLSSLIIRTSWLYSEYGHNFMNSMKKLGQDRDSLRIVYDQIGTPTYARDLAKATMTCIEKHNIWVGQQEIYHFSNEGVASWYDFALAIFEKDNISCQVQPILSKDYPTKAKRPPYSVLDKSKFKVDFGIDIPHWLKSLKSFEL